MAHSIVIVRFIRIIQSFQIFFSSLYETIMSVNIPLTSSSVWHQIEISLGFFHSSESNKDTFINRWSETIFSSYWRTQPLPAQIIPCFVKIDTTYRFYDHNFDNIKLQVSNKTNFNHFIGDRKLPEFLLICSPKDIMPHQPNFSFH